MSCRYKMHLHEHTAFLKLFVICTFLYKYVLLTIIHWKPPYIMYHIVHIL